MARKTGQIVRRGPTTWLVRIYVGSQSGNSEAPDTSASSSMEACRLHSQFGYAAFAQADCNHMNRIEIP